MLCGQLPLKIFDMMWTFSQENPLECGSRPELAQNLRKPLLDFPMIWKEAHYLIFIWKSWIKTWTWNAKLENDSGFWKVLLSVLLLSLQDSGVPSPLVHIKIRPLSGNNCCRLFQPMILANANSYYWFLSPVFKRQHASFPHIPFNKSHPFSLTCLIGCPWIYIP